MPAPTTRTEWETEATLDPAITADAPLTPHAAHPQALLLTGATGFLGAYLLAELLEHSSARLYCLVRAEDETHAQTRIQQNLARYGLWAEAYQQRVVPVAGDLAQPVLGLSPGLFAELASLVDGVIHNGGWVNFLHPYSKLKATNVTGTQEALRLACTHRLKPFHFVSSLAIFLSGAYPPAATVSEATPPAYSDGLTGGYKQSKWVADQMVRNARRRQIPATIYRPARIAGHSQSGITGDIQDPLMTFLKGCILLGAYPESDVALELVPVDYASKALARLVLHGSADTPAFHLLNPHPLSWRGIFAHIHAMGHPVEGVCQTEWWARLRHALTSPSPHKPVFSLLRLLLKSPNNNFFTERPHFDTEQTRAALHGSGIMCPSVDELVPVYLAHLAAVGLSEANPTP